MSEFVRLCERAARVGGEILLSWRDRFKVSEKGPADLVTEADLASQEAIRMILLDAYPDHEFLGEEGNPAAVSALSPSGQPRHRWIVDPLDGTTNYVHGFQQYSVSIAVEQAGKLLAGCVYDPCADECYTAAVGEGAFLNGQQIKASACQRLDKALVAVSLPPQVSSDSIEIRRLVATLLAAQSIRRLGSSALNLCYVAAGRLDAYWATSVKIWDVAAGALIVQEAGGSLEAFDGGPLDLSNPRLISAGSSELTTEVRAAIANT